MSSSQAHLVGDSRWRSPNHTTRHPSSSPRPRRGPGRQGPWAAGVSLGPGQPPRGPGADQPHLPLAGGPGWSPRVSRKPRTERPPSGGWSCGWHTVGCACPPPAIGRTSRGHRCAGAARANVGAESLLSQTCLCPNTLKTSCRRASGTPPPRVSGLWLLHWALLSKGVKNSENSRLDLKIHPEDTAGSLILRVLSCKPSSGLLPGPGGPSSALISVRGTLSPWAPDPLPGGPALTPPRPSAGASGAPYSLQPPIWAQPVLAAWNSGQTPPGGLEVPPEHGGPMSPPPRSPYRVQPLQIHVALVWEVDADGHCLNPGVVRVPGVVHVPLVHLGGSTG